ncbi:hypothetical protein THAOC_01156, partial [Thalassiosira oceanica]
MSSDRGRGSDPDVTMSRADSWGVTNGAGSPVGKYSSVGSLGGGGAACPSTTKKNRRNAYLNAPPHPLATDRLRSDSSSNLNADDMELNTSADADGMSTSSLSLNTSSESEAAGG